MSMSFLVKMLKLHMEAFHSCNSIRIILPSWSKTSGSDKDLQGIILRTLLKEWKASMCNLNILTNNDGLTW